MGPQPRARGTAGAWAAVLLAAALEVVWALALAASDGFSHLGWSVLGISVALLSLAILASALRSLPLGAGYAVWVGIGSVSVAAVGIVFLDEPVSPLRLGFLTLIVIGTVGLAGSNSPAPPGGGTASTGADR